MKLVLCAVFFISGASALIFETLWFSQAGLLLGNSVWASSLVLSGFMCGLALGSALAAKVGDRLGNPIRAYAVLEIAIVVTGVGLVYVLPQMSGLMLPVLTTFQDAPWVLNLLRLLAAFLLLMIPSTAMGFTLPLLTRSLLAFDISFGRVLGVLYGWNTMGAVVGAIVTETHLIATFGVRGSALIAGSFNLLAAAVAMAVQKRFSAAHVAEAKAETADETIAIRSRIALLISCFLSGFILLALEVVWFRFMFLFVVSRSLSFAVMLSIVLAGIALGGIVASQWLGRDGQAYRFSPAVAFLAGLLCIISYASFSIFFDHFLGSSVKTTFSIIVIGLSLMAPVSFLSGTFFTLVGAALKRHIPSAAGTTGLLAMVNTLGAALGAFVAGFVFLPIVGIEASFFLLAALYGVVGAAARFDVQTPKSTFRACLAVFLISLALFPFGSMMNRHIALAAGKWASPSSNGEIIGFHEGITETVLVIETRWLGQRHFLQLVTNAASMSGTMASVRRYMKLYVYLPFALHDKPVNALLISYGAGNTAKALIDSPTVESIDIVDISRDVVEMSDIIFEEEHTHPLHDPRVHIHIEDGRYFLQTSDMKYDLITGEPPPPEMAGVVNLFSREYFELARDRLAEGGIITYWLPIHSLSDTGSLSIVRAFCDVFPDATLWHGSGMDLMLMGSRNALRRSSLDVFLQQWKNPLIAREMSALGFERPEQIGALFIGDAEYLRSITKEALPLVDNYPRRIIASPSTELWPYPLYREWFDVDAARRRFNQSSWVRDIWPEELIESSLPYFDYQQIIGHMGALWPEFIDFQKLHTILRQSNLRTPAIWLMKSDDDLQKIVAIADLDIAGRADYQYHQAVGLIADRDYARSLPILARAENDPRCGHWARALGVYLLCMQGQTEDARILANKSFPEAGENVIPQEFWDWIEQTYRVNLLEQEK